jgi:glycosyltransferase involved in cell wall biosynthesis
MTTPLVSCIMPTYDRRAFVARAIDYFRRQDWPHRELIVVDDGNQAIADLTETDPRIRYHRIEGRRTVGYKRNVACELAQGDFISHWDDDDWYPPSRIRRQVAALEESGADLCGSTQLYYWDPRADLAWCYRYRGSGCLMVGTTLCYRTAAWARTRFADLPVSEDNRFLRELDGRLHDLADPSLCVGLVHGTNTGAKRTGGLSWTPVATADIRRMIGADAWLY